MNPRHASTSGRRAPACDRSSTVIANANTWVSKTQYSNISELAPGPNVVSSYARPINSAQVINSTEKPSSMLSTLTRDRPRQSRRPGRLTSAANATGSAGSQNRSASDGNTTSSAVTPTAMLTTLPMNHNAVVIESRRHARCHRPRDRPAARAHASSARPAPAVCMIAESASAPSSDSASEARIATAASRTTTATATRARSRLALRPIDTVWIIRRRPGTGTSPRGKLAVGRRERLDGPGRVGRAAITSLAFGAARRRGLAGSYTWPGAVGSAGTAPPSLKTLAALARTIWSISASGTPANCLSIHACESGKEPSKCG